METPILWITALLVGGLVMVALLAWRAPAGHQDRDGFHFGDGWDED